MVESAKSWLQTNHVLATFLGAQVLALGVGGATVLAYFTKLETRVYTMEHRGAEYTVARMEEMKQRIAVLEQKIDTNADSIRRVVDVMTRELHIAPSRVKP